MTFPDSGYSSIAGYCDDYLTRLARAGASIDRAQLAQACDLLDAAFVRGAWLFVCGNGGSAAIATTYSATWPRGCRPTPACCRA